MPRYGSASREVGRRSALDAIATAATVLSALAFAVLWFAVAVLAVAVVVISSLEA